MATESRRRVDNARAIRALVAVLLCANSRAGAIDPGDGTNSTDQRLAIIAAAVPSALLSQRASVFAVAAATMVNANETVGRVGEALASDAERLGIAQQSQYRSVTTRQRKQGIDVLLMATDASGVPRGDVISIEAKFSHAEPKLARPSDGVQGTAMWLVPRLQREANYYGSFGQASEVRADVRASKPLKAVDLELPDGTRGWIHMNDGIWSTNLPRASVATAQRQARLIGDEIYRSALKGDYRSYVAWIRPVRSAYSISVYEIDPSIQAARPIRVTALPQVATVSLSAASRSVTAKALDGIRAEISRKNPSLELKTSQALARSVLDEGRLFHETVRLQRMQQMRALGGSAMLGASAALGIVGLDLFFDVAQGDPVEWSNYAVLGTAGIVGAAAGVSAGVVTSAITVESQVVGGALTTFARTVGIAPMSMFRLVGGFSGGVVASVVTSFILAASGVVETEAAVFDASIGVAATGVAVAAEAAVIAAVMAYGSASTGTAISSLSGAAATNATLAWFGGGSLATGGMGTWGGAFVLGGGAVVIAAVAGYALYSVYSYYNDRVADADWTSFISAMRGRELSVLHDFPAWYRAKIVH